MSMSTFAGDQIALSSPIFKSILEMCGAFHDSEITASEIDGDRWELTLHNIYFWEEGRYNIGGTNGARFSLCTATEVDPQLTNRLINEDIFEFLVEESAAFITLSRDGFRTPLIAIDANKSYFQWIFKKA